MPIRGPRGHAHEVKHAAFGLVRQDDVCPLGGCSTGPDWLRPLLPRKRTFCAPRVMSASLIGRSGSSAFRLPSLRCRCRSRALASLRNRHQGPSIMGSEDEAEQSIGRPCRQTNGGSKRPSELTSSIVPRGTSFHRRAELNYPPIGLSCRCRGLFPGPTEFSAVNPVSLKKSLTSPQPRPSRPILFPRNSRDFL